MSVLDASIVLVTDTMLPTTTQPPAAVLGAARALVTGLDQVLWAARSPVELLDTVQACEVLLRSTLDAVELAVVAEIDATNAAAVAGWASTKDYLTAVTGGLKGAGRRRLALARAVKGDRAATGAALAAGDISRVQAQVVAAAVDRLPVDPGVRGAAEQLLLEMAHDHDATDLTAVGRRIVERLDPDGTERAEERALEREERAAHRGRFLSISEDGIGGVRVTGRGSVEDAAHLKAMLFSLAAPQPTSEPGACGGTPAASSTSGGGARAGTGMSCGMPDCAHDGRDPRDHGVRMWDALIEASRLLASTDVLPTSHAAPSTGQPHPRLPAAPRSDRCRDPGHRRHPVRGRRPDPGLRRRHPPCRARLEIPDPAAGPPIACDAHHILHWVDGGTTALHNLVLLCRTHHTMIHTTPWDVRLNPDDQHPEFLPPTRLDPDRRPRRRQPLRT